MLRRRRIDATSVAVCAKAREGDAGARNIALATTQDPNDRRVTLRSRLAFYPLLKRSVDVVVVELDGRPHECTEQRK
jgi:hypothetical protein